jgi:hypothetical protein
MRALLICSLLALATGCGGDTSGTDPADSGSSQSGDSGQTAATHDSGPATDTAPAETDYLCGWPHNDPGNLISGGALTGDVIDNLLAYDQCGEVVDLWDLFGSYNLIFIAGAW